MQSSGPRSTPGSKAKSQSDVESTAFYDNCWLVSHCWAKCWERAAGGGAVTVTGGRMGGKLRQLPFICSLHSTSLMNGHLNLRTSSFTSWRRKQDEEREREQKKMLPFLMVIK
ncbi:hypothetical protein M5D96_005977 [Drosophila gunungcola]|uniref:Uncharacterized protein n=1 Tax=Drosophila gunungcola TaxID=103775 RepID=A0A9P9YR98_9MUSC|nr:hypothetical protein M5D96_005977 [Drosophila gunungcola]